MIVYSPEQYLVLVPNTMVLEKDGNYFYVEKSLYDSLIILKHNYSVERVGELLGKENNLETIEWLIPQLPSPLDIIAPFLRLINKELYEDLELCIGSLHELFCTGLNPHGFIQLPMEARRGIEFGRTGSVYPEMWASIMTQYVPYETVQEMLENINKFNNIQYPQVPQFNYGMMPVNPIQNELVEEKEEFEEFAITEDGKFLFEDEDSDEIEPLVFTPRGEEQVREEVATVVEDNATEEATNDDNDEVALLRKALLNGGNV